MVIKNILVLIALISGCAAIPTPAKQDLSVFFEQTDASTRLVGGTPAPLGSAPHMVALSSGSQVRGFNCGGSLISSRTVLTAAHCIDPHVAAGGALSSSLRGTIGTNRWNLGGADYTFSRYVNHPAWSASIIKNDIGLLITSTQVVLSALAAPVQLGFDYVDVAPVRVTGWGRLAAGGAVPEVLREIYTNTISGQQCIADAIQASIDLNMSAPPVDPAVEICTFHSAGFGNCNGDSGSALVEVATGLQIGIVSWGFPCALGAPDMFTRVSAYRNWLTANAV